jgi:predicted nucleic acid-binding Zn ribbon protein
MIKLSQSIKKLLKTTKFNPLFLGNLENKWETIVGTKIAGATKIIKTEKETLYIKCKNPTWKNELQYQKKEILKKINKTTTKIKKIILI